MGLFTKRVRLSEATDNTTTPGGTDTEDWYYGLAIDRAQRGVWLASMNVDHSWAFAKEFAKCVFPGARPDFAVEKGTLTIGDHPIFGGVKVDLEDTDGVVEALTGSPRPVCCFVLGESWRAGTRTKIFLLLLADRIESYFDPLPPATSVVPKPPPSPAQVARKAKEKEQNAARNAALKRVAKLYPVAGRIAKAAYAERLTAAQAEALLEDVEDLEFLVDEVDYQELAKRGFAISEANEGAFAEAINDMRNHLEDVIDAEDAEERRDATDSVAYYAKDLLPMLIDSEGLDP